MSDDKPYRLAIPWNAHRVTMPIGREVEAISMAMADMPTRHAIVIAIHQGGPTITFHPDGRLTVSPDLTADETARAFLDALNIQYAQCVAGWRPIETAPKDGTRIDVWVDRPVTINGRVDRAKARGGYRLTEVWWDDGWTMLGPVPFARVKHEGDEITHWSPIPAGPSGESP